MFGLIMRVAVVVRWIDVLLATPLQPVYIPKARACSCGSGKKAIRREMEDGMESAATAYMNIVLKLNILQRIKTHLYPGWLEVLLVQLPA